MSSADIRGTAVPWHDITSLGDLMVWAKDADVEQVTPLVVEFARRTYKPAPCPAPVAMRRGSEGRTCAPPCVWPCHRTEEM